MQLNEFQGLGWAMLGKGSPRGEVSGQVAPQYSQAQDVFIRTSDLSFQPTFGDREHPRPGQKNRSKKKRKSDAEKRLTPKQKGNKKRWKLFSAAARRNKKNLLRKIITDGVDDDF